MSNLLQVAFKCKTFISARLPSVPSISPTDRNSLFGYKGV